MYGGATAALLRALVQNAQEGRAQQEMVTAAEPRAPLLPQHRRDVDDAPPARTEMERAAMARGEEINEIPLGKMEMLLGPGWFSHGKG